MNEYEKFINELELPPTKSTLPSVYAFSLHKSGSTLLYNMLADLAPYVGQSYFSIQDQFFINGIHLDQKITGVESFFKPLGYVYGGFRYLSQYYEIPDLEHYKKILLIRNPLDVMVSRYFSSISSHKIPEKGRFRDIWLNKREKASTQSIDQFVRGEYKEYLMYVLSYKDILNQSNCLLFRYEDIIYSKKEFLLQIVNFYGWNIDDDVITEVANKYDVFPDQEDQAKHIRQVHPGNYKKHLSKDTQLFLQDKFDHVLEAFGYKENAQNAFRTLNQYQEANG